MTKPITTFFFSLVLLCNILNGQCDVDPLQGLSINHSNFLCGDMLDGFQGKLPLVNSPEDLQPVNLCDGVPDGGGKPDNIAWYSFIATSFTLDLDIYYDNCNEPAGQDPLIQTGIYGSTDFTDILVCNSGNVSASPINLSANNLEVGKIYYIFLDGFNYATETSTCDFRIEVNAGVNSNPYVFDWKNNISQISAVNDGVLTQGSQNVCIDAGIIYNYTAPICEAKSGVTDLENFENLDVFCYEWTFDPPGSGIILGDPNAREIEVEWQTEGNHNLSVDISPKGEFAVCLGDVCTDAQPISITSGTAVREVRDTIEVCIQDPYPFCGEFIAETTTITCIEDKSTCVEVVQPFKLLENDTIDYGTFVNCGNNNCFTLYGFDYCQTGTYILPDTGSCNIFHKVVVEGFFVEVDLPSTMQLDCDNGNLVLSPDINTNYVGTIDYEWYEASTLLSTSRNLDVLGTGTYELRISFPDLDSNCSASHVITITESMDAPKFSLNVPTLDCNHPVGLVEFNEIDDVSSVLWQGPNGFSNTNNSFTTNQGGSFKLTVIGSNGCLNDTTFTVREDFSRPSIDLAVDNLNCLIRTTKASYESNTAIESSNWELPSGLILASDTLIIDTPGNYELTLIGENGCTTKQPFEITENVEMPSADAGDDMIWQCNTESLMIDGTVSGSSLRLSWSFVEKGDITSDPTKASIEVASEGTYILKALNFESGCEMSDSMTIARNEDVPDSMEYVKVDPSCFQTSDGMIQVINVNGGSAPYRYFLNGVQTEEDFVEDLNAGLYTLMVLDDYDCRLTVDVDVLEQPEISLANMPSRVTIGYNELHTFYALHNLLDSDVQAIYWYDENGNLLSESDSLVYKTEENTSISVEVVNQNGCAAIRSIPVEVDFDLPVFAPNIFSPNEDGVNDYFTLFKRDDYPSEIVSLSIFNRWGEQVFAKRNLDFGDENSGWDGRKDGQLLESAVFTYSAIVKLVDGKEKLVKGEVTLIR